MPRTSPTTMRFGDKRSVFLRRFSISTVSVVVSATLFSAVHFSSFVSSMVMTRSSSWLISARMALRSVVLPEAVPPAAMMFFFLWMASKMTSRCFSVMAPCLT